MEPKGIRLNAFSNGQSAVVLPVQFSRCFRISHGAGAKSVRLFRANLLQLGVLFENEVDVRIDFRIGPLADSRCRFGDIEDMKTLAIKAAAKQHPIPSTR